MLQPNKKGCKELLMRKMFFAIVSSIALQFFYMSCLVLITNLSADYTSWFQDTWLTVTSFRMWSYFCILATVTFFQGLLCSKSYSNVPPYLKSRYSKFCAAFTSQNILLSLLHVIIGGLLVWLHLSVKGGKYSCLTKECSLVYGTCLVEEYYFLLLSGFWSGLYFFTKSSLFQVKYLKFPIISLSKFYRFKQGMYAIIPSLMMNTMWPTLYYLIGYFFVGSSFRTAILFITSAQLENEPLNSISRLLNLSLIFYLWLYQLIFILTIDSMYLLFELHLTEWVHFEFKQTTVFNNEDPSITLPEALSMDKIPIMQHLGYLDLVILAQKEKSRRSILFTLSQPGGHPYNWNCIVEKCVGLIKKFSDDLNAATHKTQESAVPTSNATIAANMFEKPFMRDMRNLVKPKSLTKEETNSQKDSENEPFIQQFVKAKRKSFKKYLLSKPLIYYVFGELEGGKVAHILFNGQAVIWAAEAISSLSVLSLKEDCYGIVQKDLPLIINTLLSLKQVLDKLQKSNILMKKQDADDKFIKQIFSSLRAASKRSLYRIVTKFEDYIMDLALEPATVEQLHTFISNRE